MTAAASLGVRLGAVFFRMWVSRSSQLHLINKLGLESGKGDHAKAICNAIKLELLMNNTMEATAFARMLGAYLKSCANFLATAHDDRFPTFAEYINGIVQRRHDAFEEVLAYAKANGIVQGGDGCWRSTRPRPDFLCSDDSESDSSDGEDKPEDTKRGRLQLEGLPKDCSEQDIRNYLKKHRDDDPEPIGTTSTISPAPPTSFLRGRTGAPRELVGPRARRRYLRRHDHHDGGHSRPVARLCWHAHPLVRSARTSPMRLCLGL